MTIYQQDCRSPTLSARTSRHSALVPRIRLLRAPIEPKTHDDDFEGIRNWTVILTLSAIAVFLASCPVLVLA